VTRVALIVALWLWPVAVLGQTPGRHCLDSGHAKWVMHQLAVTQLNPGGVEVSARAGVCLPLVRDPRVLLTYTHVETGALANLSPAYLQLGGYAQITPLSPLQLRVELSGLGYWPLFFSRAGYFALSGYDADFRSSALPHEMAGTATGWNLNLIAVLRFRAPSEGAVRVFGLNLFSAERWSVGDADYYFNLRRDLPLARADWVVVNEGLLGVETRLSGELHLRLGVFDSVRWVPASDYVGNQVGILAMLWHPSPTGLLRDLQPFVRVGIHTHHAFRAGTVAVMVGSFVSYDLGDV